MVFRAAALLLLASASGQTTQPSSFELLTHRMDVDVDGAPNAYGPPGKPALDSLNHAYALDGDTSRIVGFLTERDGHTPIVQGPHDPFPGYYISTTAFADPNNDNDRDPRAYLDARHINYVVLGKAAKSRGARIGDLVSVYSVHTHRAAFAVVGDSGNPTGDEGSLHLLQDLGYGFRNGTDDAVENAEIIIRFYPHSNPHEEFFFTQQELNRAAERHNISRDFSESPLVARAHPNKR